MERMESNPETLNGLASLLAATLGMDDAARKRATVELSSLSARPGYALCLVNILSSNTVSSELKLSAAILFKNFIKLSWQYASSPACDRGVADPLTPADRDTIKNHLTKLMLNSTKNIQAQLAQSLGIISAHDFPSRWQGLLPQLIIGWQGSADERNGALQMCHSIFMRYRHEVKSEALWQEIKYVLDLTAEELTKLLFTLCAQINAVMGNPSAALPVLTSVHLICEIFYSLNYQDIPEYFEDHLKDWFGCFQSLLQLSVSLPNKADEPNVLDLTHAVVCDIVNLYTWKYEDQFKDWVPIFVEETWKLMARLGEEKRYDLLVNAAIRFLTCVVKKDWYKHLFNNEAILKQVCERVIIPQLKLRESDMEMFNMNPIEYIRTDIEGSDVDTRRRTTVDFIRGLTLQWEVQITEILKVYVNGLLAEYAANIKNEKGMLAKDAALYIIMALSAKTSTSAKGVTATNPYIDIGQFFQTQILSELNAQNINDNPILKADALKFVAFFRQQLPVELYIQLMPLLVKFLRADEVVVHSYAAYAIERLLTVKESNGNLRFGQSQVRPFLQSILENLFVVLEHEESKENEYAMKAIMRVCAVGQDAMTPFAPVIIQKVTHILSYVSQNPKNPQFNHNLFESISCLVKFLCQSDASLINSFESSLFPPFQSMLSMETCVEFSPYIFQIMSQILELRPDISPTYQSVFPSLLLPALYDNVGNSPALVKFLQAYIRKGAHNSVMDATRLDGVMGVFQKLLAVKSTEEYGLQLITTIVEQLPIGLLGKYVLGVFQLVFGRLQKQPSPKLLRFTFIFFSVFFTKHGVETVINAINQIQTNIFAMLYEKLWLPNMHVITTTLDKKTVCIGLTLLLVSPVMHSQACYQVLLPQTIVQVLTLLSVKSSKQHSNNSVVVDVTGAAVDVDDADDFLAQSEKGFSTAFAKLVFAFQSEHDPNATVNNLKAFVQHQLDTFAAQQPGKFHQYISQAAPAIANEIQELSTINQIAIK